MYAAGIISGTGTYDFGNSVTATGIYTDGDPNTFDQNIVLVKYNSSGVAQWARTVTAGDNQSFFSGVSAGSDGSVYAAGGINGTGTYGFGNSVTATGASGGSNTLLVKYY